MKLYFPYREERGTVPAFDKLYTVEDIAKMTMLTTRTIRNYLKEGLLKGKRVGGQWRFTKEDIDELFENSQVEQEMRMTRRQEVMDFIDGVNTDMAGAIQICSVADYYCSDADKAAEVSRQFQQLMQSREEPFSAKYFYEYLEGQGKARYTFLGGPRYVSAATAILEREWNRINGSLDLFTGKAADYVRYRPSYPEDAVRLLLTLLPARASAIADIGSGTGKLTELLLGGGRRVYGGEPNGDLRREADVRLAGREGFISVAGTAESTTLDTDSVDLIAVAEAYHWFDREDTRLEFRRILRPGGYAALLWNCPGQSAYGEELDSLNRRLCPEYGTSIPHRSKDERAAELFGECGYQTASIDNPILEPFEAFAGGMLSASFAPREGDPAYEEYVEGLRRIFNRYAENGLIEARFTTVCYYGQLSLTASLDS